MGAALAEYVEQKSSDVPKQLRGTRWPGNVFDRKLLLDVFKRNLDGRAPLLHASPSSMRTCVSGIACSSTTGSLLKRAGLQAWPGSAP